LVAPDNGPRLRFLENVDPQGFSAVIDKIDWREAALLIVSKSGSTAETLGQALVLLPQLAVQFQNADLSKRLAVITEPRDNPLTKLAERFGARRIPHHPGIGGRFSVLSVTGCLPALLAGLDVSALRRGALATLEQNLVGGAAQSAAAKGAALAIGLARDQGLSQSVLLSYVDRLADFGLWYRQLWAESLGKDGQGTTPIRAMGTVDQHSQLQLYLDGPKDKLITLLALDTAGQGPVMAADLAKNCGLDSLAGHSLGDLLQVSARATGESLIARGRALRWLTLSHLDEECLGGLFMHFMLETVLAAALLDLDPFDQPAVEEGKVLARKYLQDMAPKGPAS
jgi:glucose-6-phosphate isomerase